MDATSNGSKPVIGYDRVVVPGPNGSTKELSRREFEGLPLRERVAYLIEGTARFFCQGLPVNATDAMKG